MPHQITVTKLLDGHRPVIHIHLKSDGASPDLADEVIVDPADYGMSGPNRFFTIDNITSALAGFHASLKFNYLASGTPVWVLTEGSPPDIDFTYIGGLKDRSPTLDGTGKIMISTKGFSDSGDEGTIILRLKK